MGTYRYLSDLRQNRNDESITEPAISYEFPHLDVGIEEPSANAALPPSRVLVTVRDIDANMDRAILAIPNVSKWVVS